MKNTIKFPSGKYYTKKNEVVNSLFVRGGTASGYYKKLKNGIRFYTLKDEPFLMLIANKHNEQFFVTCHKYKNTIRYMYAVSSKTEKDLGLDTLTYSEDLEFAKNTWMKANK